MATMTASGLSPVNPYPQAQVDFQMFARSAHG